MLYVSFHRYVKPRDEATKAMLDEHLAWNYRMHQAGRFIFSGPLWDRQHILNLGELREPAASQPDREFVGMILFHAASLTEARDLMAQEPFVKHGFRVCDVFEWEVHQAFGCGPFTKIGLQQSKAERAALHQSWENKV